MANLSDVVKKTVARYAGDAGRMLDIINDIQSEFRCVSDEAVGAIARELNVSSVDVEGIVTFYHFFTREPAGRYSVYLNDSVVSNMKGRAAVARAFERETGTVFGGASADGLVGLFSTSCIGMSDQEPAAIINGSVFTRLDEAKVKFLVSAMKSGMDVKDMVKEYGDGQNQSELIRSMVNNNIRKRGQVLFSPYEAGAALKKMITMSPGDVIDEIKKSNLRGRGGAGFPTGMKWESTRKSPGDRKFVICNADEGEPGTFKDRVILTELPRMLFEGMAVAGYAIGAEEGIVYLRAEYAYLRDYLENVLADLRKNALLGKNIAGKSGFNFDIRIMLGAGPISAVRNRLSLESAEGRRGQPRNRPPFPAQSGYLKLPTSVNNVESFCAAAKIMTGGADWFKSMGTAQSKGTKLLSVSGDCDRPGIYEIEFGTTVQTLLEDAGGAQRHSGSGGRAFGQLCRQERFWPPHLLRRSRYRRISHHHGARY
jgi:[NiFe] hydrogenase diaphorase moiety large subunit